MTDQLFDVDDQDVQARLLIALSHGFQYDGNGHWTAAMTSEELDSLMRAAAVCKVNLYSSRCCEWGTKGCDVVHDKPRSIWTLITPEGRRFTGATRFKAIMAEVNSRISATQQLANLRAATLEPAAPIRYSREWCERMARHEAETNATVDVGPAHPALDDVLDEYSKASPAFDPTILQAFVTKYPLHTDALLRYAYVQLISIPASAAEISKEETDAPARKSLDQRIADAKQTVESWSPEKRASVIPQGTDPTQERARLNATIIPAQPAKKS